MLLSLKVPCEFYTGLSSLWFQTFCSVYVSNLWTQVVTWAILSGKEAAIPTLTAFKGLCGCTKWGSPATLFIRELFLWAALVTKVQKWHTCGWTSVCTNDWEGSIYNLLILLWENLMLLTPVWRRNKAVCMCHQVHNLLYTVSASALSRITYTQSQFHSLLINI